MNTLLEVIQRAPGSATAVILPETGVRVTYDSLRRQVAAVADAFRSAGIGPGDRVAMSLPNGLDTIVCFLAASIAGTAAPLNPGYRHDEFVFYLEDTNAKLLVVPPQGADDARRAAADKHVPIVEATVTTAGEVQLSPTPSGKTAGPPDPDAVALVLHTSGSTGRPKRVPLKHRNLAVSAENIIRTYSLGPTDVAMIAMPLFHVHGLVASTLSTLASGGAVVVPPKFNPLSFW
ncbi:MAG TPA: AMP-binding protein, partial [Terriglobia bacterium]|nr:AMP-binding protein [Terriglobia bacterium]